MSLFSLFTFSFSSSPRVLRSPTVSLAVRDASIVAGSFARPSSPCTPLPVSPLPCLCPDTVWLVLWAGDGAPRSLSVRSSGVCWTRPFSVGRLLLCVAFALLPSLRAVTMCRLRFWCRLCWWMLWITWHAIVSKHSPYYFRFSFPHHKLATLLFGACLARRNRTDPYEEKKYRGPDIKEVQAWWKQCQDWIAQFKQQRLRRARVNSSDDVCCQTLEILLSIQEQTLIWLTSNYLDNVEEYSMVDENI